MKIRLFSMLLVPVLVGCAHEPPLRSRADPLAPTQGETGTEPEGTVIQPAESTEVFPHFKPVYRQANLRWIEAYCKKRGIRPLDSDHVRLFTQPMGFVSEAIDVDLASGQMTVYPGDGQQKEIVRGVLAPDQVAQVKSCVTSEEFKRIPMENETVGFDGVSYLLEASVAGDYSCKLHWVPQYREFLKIVDFIRSLD